MSSLKDIYWMSSPLAIEQRNYLIDKEKHVKTHKFRKPVARFVDPKNEVHVFRKIQHWTLEIDDQCYELSPDLKKKLPTIQKATDMIKPRSIEMKDWQEIRDNQKIVPEKRRIGQTKKTHEEILAASDFIWTEYYDDWYGFFTQNCQNFAHMLFERVVIEKPAKGDWETIPDPIGYRLAEGAQLALATKIAGGTKAAYLTAAAKAAPASQGVGAAGTMGATSGGAASGGTAAVGGTGTAAASSTTAGGTAAAGSTGTVAAGGTTAGGTAAATGTAASGTAAAGGTGTVAAGGTTAATGTAASGTAATGTTGTAAAGTTGTAAATGTTAGTTTAGGSAVTSHIGVGAKVAGLMHGGHAAAIGSGMAKAGVVAAYTHPVTGLALTGGMAYLAYRGKRGKRWNKKTKKPEDMDVFDLLEGEDAAFEEAENPDLDMKEELEAELNDPDKAIDEELTEELKLGLVTTEPIPILEEDEAISAGQDARRAHTTS